MLYWLQQLTSQSQLFVTMVFKTAYIWFGKRQRKPPDKSNSFRKIKFMDVITTCLIFLEDIVYILSGFQLDLCYWIYFLAQLSWSLLQGYLTCFLSVSFDEETFEDGTLDGIFGRTNPEIIVHSSNKREKFRYKKGQVVSSNIVLSLAVKNEKNPLSEDVINLDTDSYVFAIDTCTTYSICKHSELFTSDINTCKNLFLQGIGGKIRVTGYGSIKLRIQDDNGKKHELVIHNVLYVPESPTNLLSPQQWSKSSANPNGTGEVTCNDTTMLFWDNHKYSKLVPHHPELKIPLMTVNDGYTKTTALMNSLICHPCNNVCFHTSEAILAPDNVEHIIPVDDDDEEFEVLQKRSSLKPILVDELDQIQNISLLTELEGDTNVPGDDDDLLLRQTDDGDTVGTEVQLQDETSVLSGDSLFEDTDVSEGEEEAGEVEIPQNEIDTIVRDLGSTLSSSQKELLKWHYKLKHRPFSQLRSLAERGSLPKHLAKVQPPMCIPCLMGKQHKKPWRGRGKGSRKSIRKPHENFPGANTSTDQMISPFGGLIPQLKGRLMKAKYYAAQVHVDHYTDYTYVHLMKDTTAESTLEAKNAYERLLATFGHRVRAYHADNGRFAETLFMQDVKDKSQKITFCGVGSHHQNGIAERRIKELSEDARTMLAHGQHMWPEVVTKALWPFAIKAAARSRNKFRLNPDGLSPEELISGIKVSHDLKSEHPLFCPVYALDKRLQGGLGGLPKWEPRSNAGIYLGHSPEHASNVALVLNLTTGLVSPQYHVVFDDDFTTVEYLRTQREPTNWEVLCKNHTEDYRIDSLPGSPPAINDFHTEMNHWFGPSEGDTDGNNGSSQPSPSPEDDDLNFEIDHGQDQPIADSTATEGEDQPQQAQDEVQQRRTTRQRRPTQKLLDSANDSLRHLRRAFSHLATFLTGIECTKDNIYMSFKANIITKLDEHHRKLMNYTEAIDLNVDGSYNYMHPLSFAAQTAGNEVYHFHQAMQEDDREDFIKAMEKEIKDFDDNGFWELTPRDAIGDKKLIKFIWSFKRKRRPDGSLLKHKARLCAHGGMQVYGENYWDTYAPVVNWMSVRMMLTLAVIHELYTTSIDFTLAFPQAECECEIYCEIPRGCEVPLEGEYVYRLVKNVYGLKQGSSTWFKLLSSSLTTPEEKAGYGFTQSLVDPCVFYKKGVILISWVDDCLIFARTKEDADKLIEDLRKQFMLTEEDSVDAYLGVKLEIDDANGKVTMSQPFLIAKIIEALGDSIRDANIKDTPAVYKEILHKDEDGPDRKCQWNYRSLVGMLNYLAASTRPDILFAVHQCARFSANPKLSHERALKRIIRYLKGTATKGIILDPNKSEGVKCYVDADFAGGYSDITKENPVSVFSRTGYVIFYCGCPIVWVSKLQSEISLSTVEAEYIALSQAMRDIIPFIDQIKEMDEVFEHVTEKPVIKCSLFEDNNGALELARAPRYRPRTKHIAIKYHHFREHVRNGTVEILPIDTKDQIADQFTKGLQNTLFKFLRRKLLGW